MKPVQQVSLVSSVKPPTIQASELEGDLKPLAVTVSQMAKMLAISKPTAYQLVRRSDFPSFAVGNKLLVSMAGLEKWVQEQAQGGLGGS